MEHQAHMAHAPTLPVDAGAVVSPLQIVCAWCQQHIAWHRVPTPMPFPISYSICARCYAAVARDLAPLVLPRLDCVPCDHPERASARPA